MIVLGIDPGLANTGYGVVRRDGGRMVALDGGVIETRPGLAHEQRLAAIFARVDALLAEHDPDAVAVEDLYFGANAKSAFAVGQARGVVLSAAGRGASGCACYTPQQVKSAVCGSGRADKDQVTRWCRRCSASASRPAPTTPRMPSRWPSATRTGRR